MRLAIIAAVSLAFAAGGIYAARRVPSPPGVPSAVLIYRASSGVYRVEDDSKTREDRALSLVLASITPRERQHVLDLVRNTTARLETRLSPLGTDFDDGDPMKQLQHETARYMPALTAARELDRGSWRTADVNARVTDSCLGASVDETCVPLWRGTSSEPYASPLEGRARLLAWAAAAAAIILPDDIARARDALRERTTVSGGSIALVLDAAALGFADLPERATMKDAAHRLGRAMAANELRDDTHLESLGRAPPNGRSAPWLALAPSMLLVVPRLSGSVNPRAFAREIEAAAGRSVWVIRPGR